jgi:hypothetical protein
MYKEIERKSLGGTQLNNVKEQNSARQISIWDDLCTYHQVGYYILPV